LIHPSGMERFFAEIEHYLGSLSGPPDHEVILEINARYGIFPSEGGPLT
jgi:hypothetical protein